MFEKLFLLVKNNAGKAVIENPEIAAKDREAVITEASSTIIDVLKAHIETGKMKDLVSFFQLSGVYNNPLVNSMVNKFANRLNKYYGITPNVAYVVADELIPTVMVQLVQQSKNETKEFGLGSMFSKLTGNRTDLSGLVNNMLLAS
ncbi:hypothetical protein BDD43_1558 [Mucilaginibacter gracilis]|uniref:Uncharacterized protein n=1 Tax=Mucilaginibacter gracilis TaxID=423350 RepID=A0A495IXW5_9SPHI|nr:hypothetical protein [Mucilaginibacter gracilis]RKR81412.1 hypothetical protein BDD43_1558 [Mucilaginibacter gracilis]